MRRPFPSLSAMRAFEAYLRLGTMKAASEEIGGYPSGVSRHIHGLEAELGVPLISGSRRNVRVTETGRAFGDQLAQAFDILKRAVEEVQAPNPAPTGLSPTAADVGKAAEGS